MIPMLPMVITESLEKKEKHKNIKITRSLSTQRAVPVRGALYLPPRFHPYTHTNPLITPVLISLEVLLEPLQGESLLFLSPHCCPLLETTHTHKGLRRIEGASWSCLARDFLVLALKIPHHGSASVPSKPGWWISLSHPSSRKGESWLIHRRAGERLTLSSPLLCWARLMNSSHCSFMAGLLFLVGSASRLSEPYDLVILHLPQQNRKQSGGLVNKFIPLCWSVDLPCGAGTGMVTMTQSKIRGHCCHW